MEVFKCSIAVTIGVIVASDTDAARRSAGLAGEEMAADDCVLKRLCSALGFGV
jgi:hypothetical protein